jgi:hypothetical protein
VTFRIASGAMIAVALCSSTVRAAAPEKEREAKRNAISFEPLAILSRGFLLQYERLFGDRVSVLAGPGVRFGARQDFASETLVLHTEGRYWFVRRELISGEPGMVGLYAGLAVDLGRTRVESLSLDRSLGAMWTLDESARMGYRFVAFGFQEITPSVGLHLVHEFDERGRLAATTDFTIGANLTVGWLF